MNTKSTNESETVYEAIHENHSEVDESAFYYNAVMEKDNAADSHDWSTSNVETLSTPR